jgi:hypothetical protein
MEHVVIFAMMYVAVGAGLFAQPAPGTAEPEDCSTRRQVTIFRETLPDVLAWPVVLFRRLSA